MEKEKNDSELVFVTVLDYEENKVYGYKMPSDYTRESAFMNDLQRELEAIHGESFDFMVNLTPPNDITVEWMVDEVFIEDEYEMEIDN